MKPQIPATELQARAEYKFLSFFIIAPRGIGVRDLLGAEVWQEIVAHEANINAKLIKPFDLVRVRAEDGTFDVQLTVVARRKDGSPCLQFWPRGQDQSTEKPAIAIAAASSRAEALGVLGLHTSASDELIAKTASALRQSWHPDHATGPADRALRTEKCARINAAVDLLKLKAA